MADGVEGVPRAQTRQVVALLGNIHPTRLPRVGGQTRDSRVFEHARDQDPTAIQVRGTL